MGVAQKGELADLGPKRRYGALAVGDFSVGLAYGALFGGGQGEEVIKASVIAGEHTVQRPGPVGPAFSQGDSARERGTPAPSAASAGRAIPGERNTARGA